jgi:hypothetical protein
MATTRSQRGTLQPPLQTRRKQQKKKAANRKPGRPAKQTAAASSRRAPRQQQQQQQQQQRRARGRPPTTAARRQQQKRGAGPRQQQQDQDQPTQQQNQRPARRRRQQQPDAQPQPQAPAAPPPGPPPSPPAAPTVCAARETRFQINNRRCDGAASSAVTHSAMSLLLGFAHCVDHITPEEVEEVMDYRLNFPRRLEAGAFTYVFVDVDISLNPAAVASSSSAQGRRLGKLPKITPELLAGVELVQLAAVVAPPGSRAARERDLLDPNVGAGPGRVDCAACLG